MMPIAIAVAFVVASQSNEAWIPVDFFDGSKFDKQEQRSTLIQGEITAFARFVRRSDRVVINLECAPAGTPEWQDEMLYISHKGPHLVRMSRDQMPLGSRSASDWSDKTAFVIVFSANDHVTLGIQGEYHRDGVSRWTDSQPFDRDIQWLENMARQTLAGWAARRLDESPSTGSLGGSSTRIWMTKDRVRLVDLDELASAAGFSLTRNDALTCASFTWDSHAYQVPLGSPSVRIDGEWRPMPDLVMLKGGHFLVPEAAFTVPPGP